MGMISLSNLPNPLDYRTADHPIEELFLQRWSPRAMSGDALEQSELMRLFEAARWAPSTYNEQEWRFLFAHRDSDAWPIFFDLLMEANQTWCARASALIVVLSRKIFQRNGKPNPVHTFDSGAAFENLALQGAAMGLVVHGMAGFNRNKTRTLLDVPDEYEVEAMVAVGKPGNSEDLPEELRQRERPSGRHPVSKLICEGKFDFAD
jgi:nitroreductase